jgi:hypothetical protein
MDILLSVIIIVFVVLFFISFMMFVSSLLKNTNRKIINSEGINYKLDRIIELLEKSEDR